jgi:hypothetical protein
MMPDANGSKINWGAVMATVLSTAIVGLFVAVINHARILPALDARIVALEKAPCR